MNDLSNYMVFQPLINTAASSYYEDLAGILTGRKQWMGIEGAPSNITLQVVQPIYNYTIGGYLSQESIGVHNMQRLNFNYSYKIKLSKQQMLAFGLGGGGVLLHSNYDKVNPSDWTDEQFTGTKSILRPDFNLGIYLFSKSYFAGISVPRTIESSIINNNGSLTGHTTFDPTLWTYLLSGGLSGELSNELILTGSTLTKINVNAPVDIDVNLSLKHEKFGIGVSYRTKREVLIFSDIALSQFLQFGYCYHSYFNMKDLYLAGHEVYLLYRYQKKKPVRSQSPRF
jgi:type IX secretion system PorP/SprF family membrane protein